MRIGIGYDVHNLVKGRPLIIGGVNIPSKRGLEGHSDADVLIHSIIDALLGAMGAGDIGEYFSDTDLKWKDVDSARMLEMTIRLLHEENYRIVNLDCILILEQPKMSAHKEAVRKRLAQLLKIDETSVSVKAKTNEGNDAVGEGKAVVSHAAVLIEKSN